MRDREVQELADAYAGRCPVLISFEKTLVNLPESGSWREDLLRDSSSLVGKTRDDVEREVRQLIHGVQWKYTALSLLKSLGADPRFLPVIVSGWLDLCVQIKTRQSHIHPPIFATPLHFDSRRTCTGHGKIAKGGLEALVAEFLAPGRFPRLFLLVEEETVEDLPSNCTTIALRGVIPAKCAVDYVAEDLREAQHIMWGTISDLAYSDADADDRKAVVRR